MSVIGLVQSSYHEAVGGTAPKRGNFVLETDIFLLLSTIMQNFTPIGVTVAEISVTGQIQRYIERITADLI